MVAEPFYNLITIEKFYKIDGFLLDRFFSKGITKQVQFSYIWIVLCWFLNFFIYLQEVSVGL